MCVCVFDKITEAMATTITMMMKALCQQQSREREEALHLTRVYVCVDLVTDGGGREGRMERTRVR